MGSFALGNVYPAVPFSDRTGEEIKYWRDKAVSKAEYYQKGKILNENNE